MRVKPLPAIAATNQFYQHSEKSFEVRSYIPLREISGEAGWKVNLPAYIYGGNWVAKNEGPTAGLGRVLMP